MKNTIYVIVDGGVDALEYNTTQANNDQFARYEFHDKVYTTGMLELGSSIVLEVVDDFLSKYGYRVYGFCVPDYHLGTFINQYPEMNIYPE